jgi:hypothetical protein
MTVTHPAYWRHGHMAATYRWFLDLATVDGVAVGSSMAPPSWPFCASIGFKRVAVLDFSGYEPEHPEPTTSLMTIWKPGDEGEIVRVSSPVPHTECSLLWCSGTLDCSTE